MPVFTYLGMSDEEKAKRRSAAITAVRPVTNVTSDSNKADLPLIERRQAAEMAELKAQAAAGIEDLAAERSLGRYRFPVNVPVEVDALDAGIVNKLRLFVGKGFFREGDALPTQAAEAAAEPVAAETATSEDAELFRRARRR